MYCYRMKSQLNYFNVIVLLGRMWPLSLSVIALDGREGLEVM